MSDFQENLTERENLKLKLYYHRMDNKYDEWSALVWIEGSECRKVNFFEDAESCSYGRVAKLELENLGKQNKIFFAIGKLDRNDKFIERECEDDRFVLGTDADENGCIEAYVIHGKKELQKKERDLVVNMHYRRWRRDYKDWDVHTWINGKKEDVKFVNEEDPYWKVAKCKLSGVKPADKFGFIIRKGGNKWSDRECREKAVNLRSYDRDGVVDIYMVQNIPKIVYNRPILVNFHYKRYDDDYDLWNIWVWKKFKTDVTIEEPGCGIAFVNYDDTYGKVGGASAGKVATFILEPNENIESIGFLIRKDNWIDRDIDQDRFVRLEDILRMQKEGKVDIYLAQGDLNIGFGEREIDLSPRIVDATFRYPMDKGKIKTVYVELNKKLYEEISSREMDNALVAPFVLEDEKSEVVPISSVQYRGEKREERDKRRFFRINLKTEGDSYKLEPFKKHYRLRLTGYKSRFISLRKLYDHTEYVKNITYDGDDLGVTYKKWRSKFRVWAPEVERVELLLYDKDTGSLPVKVKDLRRSKGGTWRTKVRGNLKGMFYKYRVYSGTQMVETIDPYAKAAGINAERGAIIDFKDTNPEGWGDVAIPKSGEITDAIITEIHVRNYSIKESSGVSKNNRGKFLGLTEKGTTTSDGTSTCLSHIIEEGYTHVQIMPIAKCGTLDETRAERQSNWGYDTIHFMVIEGTYSTDPHDPVARIKEFKKMIQTFHANGIRVVLDVVFNHTYKTQFSNLNILGPKYFHRVRGEQEEFSNATNCSNEIASERKMVRKYILDTVKYWVNEFKVDGFRFDVMYLIDKDTMNEIREEINKIDPSILVYGEGWGAETDTTISQEELAQRRNAYKMPGIAFFSNEASAAIKGSFDGTDRGFALKGEGIADKEYRLKKGIVADTYHPQLGNDYDRIKPNQVVNYVGVHDNLTWWDKICVSVNDACEAVKRKMYRLGYAILFTMQGALVVPEGDEFLRTKDKNNNSHNLGDRINGIDWNRKSEYKEDSNYIKGLIKMRKQHKGFRINDPDEIRKKVRFMDNLPDKVIGYTITDHANKDVSNRIAVVHNGGWREEVIRLPQNGWSVIVNDKSAGVEEIERVNGDKVRVLAHSSVVLVDKCEKV
ncbi:MAG: type I pullulanase [Clostridiales bacterium]|nr:type I pullulanase [Clostridiales bacterium]